MFRMLLFAVLILSLGVAEIFATPKLPATPEQTKARRTQVFKSHDKNGDGRLTLEEYMADKDPRTKDPIATVFNEADKDGKGLTIEQFLANYDILVAAGVIRTDYLKTRPFDNIKAAVLPAKWQYSRDGKTFVDKPFPAPPYGGLTSNYPYSWKGTFEVADPARIAGLWVRLVEDSKHPDTPRATICNGDLTAAAGGYWKDLGYCPTLLDAVVTLNGKEVKIANGPILYFWLPLEGELRRGTNTIELHGNVYSYWGGGWYAALDVPAGPVDARLLAAEAQPAEIYSGPILGDFGDDYFTVACRTQLPADLIVEATPLDPAGPAVTTISQHKIWHRVKAAIPKGTKKFSYTLTAKVGPHETSRGPWEVTLPTASSALSRSATCRGIPTARLFGGRTPRSSSPPSLACWSIRATPWSTVPGSGPGTTATSSPPATCWPACRR